MYAAGFEQWAFKRWHDDGLKAAANGGKGADFLYFVAHGLAATAHDALVHVAHEGVSIVKFVGRLGFPGDADVVDIEACSNFLQLAVTILEAGEAGFWMVGNQEFHNGSAGAQDAGGVGDDFHTRGYRGCAGWHEGAFALDFDNADTAACWMVVHFCAMQVHMAERRDPDIKFLGSVKDGAARWDSDFAAING